MQVFSEIIYWIDYWRKNWREGRVHSRNVHLLFRL